MRTTPSLTPPPSSIASSSSPSPGGRGGAGMLGKRARPAWDGRRPKPIAVGGLERERVAEAAMSPLERSPRGWKNRESAGVGLGIVVALEKSGSGGDAAAKAVVCSPRLGVAPSMAPWPASTRGAAGVPWERCCAGATAGAGKEVGKISCRGIFCCVDEEDDASWGAGFGGSSSCSSTLRIVAAESKDFLGFRTVDFLSYCFLCKKELHGEEEDIYMYRGDKAFCSMECRNRQISIDDYQEERPSRVANLPPDVPITDYSGGRLFCTSIAAA